MAIFGKNTVFKPKKDYILWTGFIPRISNALAITAATASQSSIRPTCLPSTLVQFVDLSPHNSSYHRIL